MPLYRLRASNEETEALIVPAVHLAEGLATDWWIIIGGRGRDHGVRRYRTGFALPDLFFRADGMMIEVTSTAFSSKNPNLRFPVSARETLPRVDAEAEMARFIDAVVDRLVGCGVRNSGIAARWSRVINSRNDPDERAFCESAGALGLDPYAIADNDAQFIQVASNLFSDESLIEFLASIRNEGRPTPPLGLHESDVTYDNGGVHPHGNSGDRAYRIMGRVADRTKRHADGAVCGAHRSPCCCPV